MSRLDYGNAVLVGLPAYLVYLVQKLQSVLNAAAQVIFHLRSAACITDVPATLYWLHVPEWIEYKIAPLTFSVLRSVLSDPYCQFTWNSVCVYVCTARASTQSSWQTVASFYKHQSSSDATGQAIFSCVNNKPPVAVRLNSK